MKITFICFEIILTIIRLIRRPRKIIINRINEILPTLNMTEKQLIEQRQALKGFSYKELQEYLMILEGKTDLEVF